MLNHLAHGVLVSRGKTSKAGKRILVVQLNKLSNAQTEKELKNSSCITQRVISNEIEKEFVKISCSQHNKCENSGESHSLKIITNQRSSKNISLVNTSDMSSLLSMTN